MITKAKASITAVKDLELAVSAVRDYSPRFARGIKCLEELFLQLSMSVKMVQDAIKDMEFSQEMLAGKIKKIEETLARLNEKLDRLEDKLEELEDKLADTPSEVEVGDGEDIRIVANPVYIALQARITAIKGEIIAVEKEIVYNEVRLRRAENVDSHLESHITMMQGVVDALEEKKDTCKQLRIELEEARQENLQQGVRAAEGLKKIRNIIADYLKIKMLYEDAASSHMEPSGRQQGIHISVNVNKTTYEQKETVAVRPEEKLKTISAEEIRSHRITFDEAGRITAYDGKTFGGKHNSYEDRLQRTSADDNPIFGRYEGIRGESKFIPAKRTAEGVVVSEILGRYGMDGINYRNAEPDFEPCSEAVVRISAMTENRLDYMNSEGETALGNFTQADIELAKAWNLAGREGRNDWGARDVLTYRKANKLTWHEKCDMETMVLVRYEINLFFKHSGGCSECRVRDSAGADGSDFDE